MIGTGTTAPAVAVRPFQAKLDAAMASSGSLVCVGLDPDVTKFPRELQHDRDLTRAIVQFNAAIIEATSDLVCAYKPNLAFYVQYGIPGLEALVETKRLIPARVPVILDCKVNDMGNTANAYARGYFATWGFDSVTVNSYLGDDAVAPFQEYGERGMFILCKTSNPGATTFQDLPVTRDGGTEPLHLTVASQIQRWADAGPATVGMVVGATYPAELAAIRARCPELPILLPGVGAQSGDVAAAVRAGVNSDSRGLLVSSSRAILYASAGDDYAAAARAATVSLHAEITDSLNRNN